MLNGKGGGGVAESTGQKVLYDSTVSCVTYKKRSSPALSLTHVTASSCNSSSPLSSLQAFKKIDQDKKQAELDKMKAKYGLSTPEVAK